MAESTCGCLCWSIGMLVQRYDRCLSQSSVYKEKELKVAANCSNKTFSILTVVFISTPIGPYFPDSPCRFKPKQANGASDSAVVTRGGTTKLGSRRPAADAPRPPGGAL